ncbi:hypothetical protein Airi01_100930 [Actinoallomurus iriomotensis]|uniref:Uncharacterized protein n=1 Tax=Actinoallomurus iriomotensis TaxID=478107 RepID=A0A9W6RU01_9ACTN|nr:hypothetical protein Airi01_100930 [Actinoallomurus iriomotensis]
MRTTTALKATATYGGPTVFGVGIGAMLAAALVASGTARHEAAGPQPSVTASPSSSTARPGGHRSPHPSPSSSAPDAHGTVLAAGKPSRTSGGGTADRVGASSTGRPSSPVRPSPSPQPSASGGASVSVRLPLGVLPTLGVDVTVGGGNSR